MAIPNEIIERIRTSLDIVDVVREYLPSIKKAGRNWKGLCPFHKEKSPSFIVSPDKGIYTCFGCRESGDVFTFVMHMDKIPWHEAVKKLASKANVTIEETNERNFPKASQRQKLLGILEQASNFYNRCLLESQDGEKAREYLKSRGIKKATIEKFKLGFAPKNQLQIQAKKKGYTQEDLVACGITVKTERGTYFEYMSGRVVFPILNSQGKVVAFGGRILDDSQPKYLNTPETQLYSKSEQLYGLYQALSDLRQNSNPIVLEGYMDVILTHQEGCARTVASLGTAFTSQQARILKRYSDKATLLFDSDNAGLQAALRGITPLIENEVACSVVFMPEGKDPDEFILQHGLAKFEAILKEALDASEFVVQESIKKYGINTPDEKAKVVSEVLPFVDLVKNSVAKSEWIKLLSEKVGVKEDSINNEFLKFKKFSGIRSKVEAEVKQVMPSIIRTAEEELLQFLVLNPEYIVKLQSDLFLDKRCLKVFELLGSGAKSTDIIGSLDAQDVSWFASLALEQKVYDNPKQLLETLCNDLKKRTEKDTRDLLKNEVELMLGGKIPKDDKKIELYLALNRKLKGSERTNAR